MELIKEALTFDDVLLIPRYSTVLPSETNLSVNLGKNLNLKIPFLSSAMDTVTESNMAIAIAQRGGLGVIHRNLSVDKQSKEIKVHGLHYIVENANAGDSLLIVDDVFDSGRSIVALKEKLSELMRLNLPRDIRIACPYYKPKNSKVDTVPDYYIHESEEWLVFPHELSGLTPDEIIAGKSDLVKIHDILLEK
mgnify:CR=1 FL=1